MTVVPGAPRRRPNRPVMLCDCDCHSGCPLLKREFVAVTVWEQQCTCPGTEEARNRRAAAGQQRGSFAEFHAGLQRERQQQRAARSEAFDAARAAAAGKTRAEAWGLYEAELRARGLPIPPDELLDAHAAAITDDRSIAPMIFAGRAVIGVAKYLGGLRTIFKNIRVFHEDD